MANALQQLESRYETAMRYLPQKAGDFRLKITDPKPPSGVNMQQVQEFLRVYAPTVEPSNFVSIGNEYSPIGGLQLASIAAQENMGFAVSCHDTRSGLIRQWLSGKAKQMVHENGTYGVPADYCLILDILSDASENQGSFGLRRMVKLESANYSHDVSADLLMLNVQFAEFDAFISSAILNASEGAKK